MSIRVKSKCLVIFTIVYFTIIFTGLRAFVIPVNKSNVEDSLVIDNESRDVFDTNDSLTFLDNFIVEDTLVPLKTDDFPKEKKVFKRSVSTNLVPQYMLDLYKYLSEKRFKVKFDTARSFRSTGAALQSSNLHRSNSISRRLTFNISSFPITEDIQFAQMRICQKSEIIQEKIGTMMKVDAYTSIGKKLTPVEYRDMVISKNSLLTLNITSSVQMAVQSGIAEVEIILEFMQQMDSVFVWDTADEEGPQLLLLSKETSRGDSPDPVFRRMKRSLEERLGLFVWDDVLEDENSSATDNRSRSINLSLKRDKRSEEEDEEAEEQSNYIVEELGRIRKGKLKKKKNPCRRKPLHVNFSTINYDQWIIAPPSYEAFECTGKCSFPMSAHLTPTKHAIIQTLMHSLEPKQISRACCVPSKLESISVLFIDDDGVVTYKYDYEDMVVAECGCR